MNSKPEKRQGTALLEVILATAIFSLVALSLMETVNGIGKLSIEVHQRSQIRLHLESILEENSKVPNIEEGELVTEPDEMGVVYEVNVKRFEVRSGEGFILPNLFLVQVSAKWKEGTTEVVETAETYRYAPLYRN